MSGKRKSGGSNPPGGSDDADSSNPDEWPIFGGPDASTLAELVNKYRIRRRPYSPLVEDNLKTLSYHIMHLRNIYGLRQSDTYKERKIINDNMRHAINLILSYGPKIQSGITINHDLRIHAMKSNGNPDWFQKQQQAFQHIELAPLINLIEAAKMGLEAGNRSWLKVWGDAPVEVDRWHKFGVALADDFRDAVQKRNPDQKRPSNSDTGLVARFMAWVIPHITGEIPRLESIAHYLRDQSRKGG